MKIRKQYVCKKVFVNGLLKGMSYHDKIPFKPRLNKIVKSLSGSDYVWVSCKEVFHDQGRINEVDR